MPYTVTTSKAVRGELVEIWLQASDQQAVADASDSIDRRLRLDPLQQAIPFGDDYILWQPPLAVVYSVYPDDCQVEIRQYIYTG